MNQTNYENGLRHVVQWVSHKPLDQIRVDLAKSKNGASLSLIIMVEDKVFTQVCSNNMLFETKCELLSEIAHYYSEVNKIFSYKDEDLHSRVF